MADSLPSGGPDRLSGLGRFAPWGFRVVELSGDAYQVGWRHGRALAAELRLMQRMLHRDVICCRGPLLGWGLGSLLRMLVARLHRHVDPRIREELRGVADGAGIPYADVLLLTCFDDAIHSLQYVVPIGRLACSALAVEGSRAPRGNVLLARNLDYAPETDWWGVGTVITRVLQTAVTLFVFRPTRGHAFLSIGWPGFLGAVTGLNDAGLAVACLTSTVRGETADGEPMPLLYRRVLEGAETLDECEAILQAGKRTIGNSLLVASARDNAARVFELSPRRVSARLAEDGILAATNHFVQPAMAAEQAGLVLPSSAERLRRLRELCGVDDLSLSRVESILADHNAVEDVACIRNGGTVYGTIVDPSTLTLWLQCPGHEMRRLDAGSMLSRHDGLWRPLSA